MKIKTVEEFFSKFDSGGYVNDSGYNVVEHGKLVFYEELPIGHVYFRCFAQIIDGTQVIEQGINFYGRVSDSSESPQIVKNTRIYALQFLKGKLNILFDEMINNGLRSSDYVSAKTKLAPSFHQSFLKDLFNQDVKQADKEDEEVAFLSDHS